LNEVIDLAVYWIKAPTLVLTGEEDVLILPGNSEILAERIPGAELLVIRGGGHQIMIEQPEACNQAIVAFLQKVDSGWSRAAHPGDDP
jgi:3-oxoadipate enol-lactonase